MKKFIIKVVSKAKENNPSFKGCTSIAYFGKNQKLIGSFMNLENSFLREMEFTKMMVREFGYSRESDARRSWIYKNRYSINDFGRETFWESDAEILEFEC